MMNNRTTFILNKGESNIHCKNCNNNFEITFKNCALKEQELFTKCEKCGTEQALSTCVPSEIYNSIREQFYSKYCLL